MHRQNNARLLVIVSECCMGFWNLTSSVLLSETFLSWVFACVGVFLLLFLSSSGLWLCTLNCFQRWFFWLCILSTILSSITKSTISFGHGEFWRRSWNSIMRRTKFLPMYGKWKFDYCKVDFVFHLWDIMQNTHTSIQFGNVALRLYVVWHTQQLSA